MHQKIVKDHEVFRVRCLEKDNYIIEFRSPGEIPEISSGNFAEIQVPGSEVFLRRPFSILDVDRAEQVRAAIRSRFAKIDQQVREVSQLGDIDAV